MTRLSHLAVTQLPMTAYPRHILLVLALTMTLPPGTALATTIKVSTTVDDLAVNNNCTLREAVIAANTDVAVDRCQAGSGADTIIVPAGTYMLTLTGPDEDDSQTGDLDIIGRATIRGAGAARTIIDGGTSGPVPYDEPQTVLDRVLHVRAGADVVLSGVTLQRGSCLAGAGLFNAGAVRVEDSAIQSNTMTWNAFWCLASDWMRGAGGAGIHNEGVITMSRSTVSGNRNLGSGSIDESAGGFANSGIARIDHSLFIGNSAAGGGALWNEGELSISDSRFTSNWARFYAAVLENSAGGRAVITRSSLDHNGDGGAVMTWAGSTITLSNSTVSNNFSYRGYAAVDSSYGGTVEIVGSTIVENWSYYNASGIIGRARLTSTIVASNEGGDCYASITSGGHNLDSDGSCGLLAAGDVPNTDPLLGPLADNGGQTPTHALLPGSPAIDRFSCEPGVDQREVARRYPRGRCDIGAYELSPPGELVLTIDDVKDLRNAGLLSDEQQFALIDLLKPAERALGIGDLAAACHALDEFAATVSDYVSEVQLSAPAAQMLLEDAGRVRGIICG